MNKLIFPDKKAFALTIFDDTDHARVENVKPVYDLLLELDLFTTKSIWVYPSSDIETDFSSSQTLADQEYLDFIRYLIHNGFEIAFHNASMSSSTRESTHAALEKFKEVLGFYPRTHTNHMSNNENLYWGPDRLSTPILKILMNLKKNDSRSWGHIPESPYFWGDLCQKHLSYVRNFVFREINLLRVNPTLPYRDVDRSFVNYWFSSSEGANVDSFNRLLSSKNQNRLEREGGVSIVYTHFANGFVENGKVNSRTRELLTELSKRNGLFVPVSTLLDHLRTQQESDRLSLFERISMEIRWTFMKFIHGTS